MKKLIVKSYFFSLIFAFNITIGADQPYANLNDRTIKALSKEEIDSLLAGRGMGLALAAELNAYPGPKHVLELAEKLELSQQQQSETEKIYQAMLHKAKQLGKAIVEHEQKLENRFSTKQIDEQELTQRLNKISALKAQLRFVHLNAHLSLYTVLTEHQNRQYQKLRGYFTSKHQHKSHH